MESESRLDYLYKEYVRLSEKAEEYIKSAFDDFRLMGVIGAAIALWKPVAEFISLAEPAIAFDNLLFLGFVSILLVISIIGFWNLIKQNFIIFFADNLQGFEEEIRKALNESASSKVFNFNLNKETTLIYSYRLTFTAFLTIFCFTVTVIPFVILLSVNTQYAIGYLILSVTIFALYFRVLKGSTRRFLKNR